MEYRKGSDLTVFPLVIRGKRLILPETFSLAVTRQRFKLHNGAIQILVAREKFELNTSVSYFKGGIETPLWIFCELLQGNTVMLFKETTPGVFLMSILDTWRDHFSRNGN